ncbi:hypothetical protein RND71_002624 [Anisodus tanguticus]|uniref:DUF4283 domain-containing protein n=1 Tax=Anisodus tanguticus TaxID=243964 RepID=A0AAE1T3Y9_9SOLA|nr:hypothetical protein RND71_002624 [Anisodus tanguticus]
MRTFKWDIWFTPEEETSMVVIWLSFPNLPPNFYVSSILFSIASVVGKPIAIDADTLKKIRPSCARVKVEADLLKEHPQKYKIKIMNGEEMETVSYKIHYDFLPKYCSTCMLQGHDLQGCWKEHPKLQPEKKIDGDGTMAAAAKETSSKKVGHHPTTSAAQPIVGATYAQTINLRSLNPKFPIASLKNATGNRPETISTAIGNPPIERSDSEEEDEDNSEEDDEEEDEEECFDSDPEDQSGDNESDVEMEDYMEESYEEEIERLFEKKEVEAMIHHQDLTLAVVGKFSHGWPDIGLLRSAIPKQCGLKADVRVGLLCDRHVLDSMYNCCRF